MKFQPAWQPIGMLPLLAQTLDEHLAQARERLQLLERVHGLQAEPAAEVVHQLRAMVGEQYSHIPVFREQLALWRVEAYTDEELLTELQRLDAVLDQLMAVLDQILALTV